MGLRKILLGKKDLEIAILRDLSLCCADGLTGIKEALQAVYPFVFPKTDKKRRTA